MLFDRWAEFREETLRADLPAGQLDALQVAYYAGALGALMELQDNHQDGESLQREIMHFVRERCRASGCGCADREE